MYKIEKIIKTTVLLAGLFGFVGCDDGACCTSDVSLVKSGSPLPKPTGSVTTDKNTPSVTPTGTKQDIPPVAIITVNGNDDFNITVRPCEKLYFDSNSTDEDGNVSNMSYSWTQLDGADLGSEKSFFHRFHNEGNYEVTLTVTDEQNLTSSDTLFVTVKRKLCR